MKPLNLNPLDFPLHGSRLIEASAGTGKTFTIALLYVRLVLGHGGEAAFKDLLTPPQILVVTFTDAATQELRDRIRARLTEAALCFLEPDREHDKLLQQLRAEYLPQDWPDCARRLQLAGEWMDEAAVSTIHGWCYRMLREHAFDSGSLFTQTLETDQSELLAEVIRDYWRRHFYELPVEQVRAIGDYFKSPQDLAMRLINTIPSPLKPLALCRHYSRNPVNGTEQSANWSVTLASFGSSIRTSSRMCCAAFVLT
jgi:exodeoxyribonuclease V beta subunit